jgi:hypothetical protein
LIVLKETDMRKIQLGSWFTGVITLLLLCQCSPKRQGEVNQELYELRVYKLADVSQEARLDSYLEKAFLPALKEQGIQDIGVFKFIPEMRDSVNQVFVLYPIRSSAQFAQLSDSVFADPAFREKAHSFIDAVHDEPPYERLEVILLKAFKDMPVMKPTTLKGNRDKRVYELRSYESPTEVLFRNKVEMFNEGGEIELFEELGFNAVFYAEVLAGSRMPNLMYMTTFKDKDTRDSLWKAFVDSSHWKKLKNDPYYANNVNQADILLLTPTPYSDY